MKTVRIEFEVSDKDARKLRKYERDREFMEEPLMASTGIPTSKGWREIPVYNPRIEIVEGEKG